MGRFKTSIQLDDSLHVRARVLKSQQIIDSKLEAGKSVYGISTGFGGSGMLTSFMDIYMLTDTRLTKLSPS